MSDQSHEGQANPTHAYIAEPVYSRPMPGGGFVRAELLIGEPADVAANVLRGRVVIERRSYAPPSAGERELVVEEVEGSSQDSVVAELVRIARDNAALARRVLRRSAGHPRAD